MLKIAPRILRSHRPTSTSNADSSPSRHAATNSSSLRPMRPMSIGTRSATGWSFRCHTTDILCTRVGLFVDRQDLLRIDVGIALRRGQAAMTEKLLNRTKIRASAQQVSGEAVPERVRADLASEGGLPNSAGHELSDASICQSTPARVDEKGVGLRPEPQAGWEPGLEGLPRPRPEGDDALLATLAEHSNHPPVEVDLGEVQADELGAPNARSVEKLEDGAATQRRVGTSRDREEAVHLALFQIRGNPPLEARRQERPRRVLVSDAGPAQVAEEGAECGQQSGG